MREGPSEPSYRRRFTSKHLPLLKTKAGVVSREGKGPAKTGSGDVREEERK
jgi:hypothetical protein